MYLKAIAIAVLIISAALTLGATENQRPTAQRVVWLSGSRPESQKHVSAHIVAVASGSEAPGSKATNTGPEHIDINTGSNGWVPFPHREHQNNLVDCTICHQHFPKEEQGILRLKNEGQLKPKQIMTTVCVQCHKDRRAQGMKAGPTGCARCHRKR